MTMKMKIRLLSRTHDSVFALIAFFAAFSLLLLTSLHAQASAVTVTDQAGVLNTGKVLTEARTLNNPVVIFTTRTFGGDQDALNQAAREQLPTQDAIAIEIDTTHRHMSVESGTKVKLSDEQAGEAVSAFRDNFHGGDYTGATIAAIDSVRDALNGGDGSTLSTVGAIVALLLIGGTLGLVTFIAFRWKRPPPNGGRGMGPHTTYNPNSIDHGGTYHIGSSMGGGGSYGGGAGGSF